MCQVHATAATWCATGGPGQKESVSCAHCHSDDSAPPHDTPVSNNGGALQTDVVREVDRDIGGLTLPAVAERGGGQVGLEGGLGVAQTQLATYHLAVRVPGNFRAHVIEIFHEKILLNAFCISHTSWEI
jgi:hypothetical protein